METEKTAFKKSDVLGRSSRQEKEGQTGPTGSGILGTTRGKAYPRLSRFTGS